MLTGYYMWLPLNWRNGHGSEIFIETDRRKLSRKFAAEILRQLDLPENPRYVDHLMCCLRRANCEIHSCTFGKYYSIWGDSFGGMGTFVNDGETCILKIA